MTDEAAAEWLAVAANELEGYRRISVEAALSDARQRCTYHGQIIPHAIKYMEESNTWRLGKPLERRLPSRLADTESLPEPEVTALIGGVAGALSAR